MQKIIFTNSPENVDFTMILGVNENKYSPKASFNLHLRCDNNSVSKLIDSIK